LNKLARLLTTWLPGLCPIRRSTSNLISAQHFSTAGAAYLIDTSRGLKGTTEVFSRIGPALKMCHAILSQTPPQKARFSWKGSKAAAQAVAVVVSELSRPFLLLPFGPSVYRFFVLGQNSISPSWLDDRKYL
jgi:hypothetical protein